ncbi:MAG: hypothetical protein AAF609_18500 [Cyanobacteria bacterium P01_C01_bin.120]
MLKFWILPFTEGPPGYELLPASIDDLVSAIALVKRRWPDYDGIPLECDFAEVPSAILSAMPRSLRKCIVQ